MKNSKLSFRKIKIPNLPPFLHDSFLHEKKNFLHFTTIHLAAVRHKIKIILLRQKKMRRKENYS